MITTEIEQQLIQYVRPMLICLNPSFGSPTGHTMSLARRRHLLEVLGNYNRLGMEPMYLLEDDSFALTRFEGDRVPALYDLSGGQTLYSSSFSATVAPGLRVGWLILPNELAGPSRPRDDLYITLRCSAGDGLRVRQPRCPEPHLARLREILRARRDAMVAALAEHLPEATWSHPEGGYFVWAQLPEPLDGRAVVARAEGVSALAGTEFGVTSSFLRLSYAAVGAGDIPEGIARLAAAVRDELAGKAA
jgi:DNA-binding transcriptional MocR family regulator